MHQQPADLSDRDDVGTAVDRRRELDRDRDEGYRTARTVAFILLLAVAIWLVVPLLILLGTHGIRQWSP